MAASPTTLVVVIQVNGGKPLGCPGERVTVGRGNNADFSVVNQHVADEHLEIILRDGLIWIGDMASGFGTQLNGMLLVPKKLFRYHPGDRLVLGRDVSLTLSVGEVSAEMMEAYHAKARGPGPEPETTPAEIERALPAVGRLAYSAPFSPAPSQDQDRPEPEIVEASFDLERELEDISEPDLGPERGSEMHQAPAPGLDLEYLAKAEASLTEFRHTLKEVHKSVGSEKRELNEQLSSLRGQVSAIRSELATLDNAKAQSRREGEILSARCTELNTQIRTAQQERTQLARLLDQEYQGLNQVREQLKELQAQIVTQRAALDAERVEGKKASLEHFSHTEKRIAGIAQSLHELQKSAGQDKRNLANELSQLRGQITGGMGELSVLEEKKSSLYEMCEGARGQLTDLTNQIHAAETQYSELQKKISESGFSLEKARGDLFRVEQETAEQQKIFDIERQLTLKESDEFRRKVEGQTHQIRETLEAIQSSVNEDKRQMASELERARGEIQSARSEVGSLQEMKATLELEIERGQQRLNEHAEQLRARQLELAELVKKIVEHKRESESSQKEIERQRALAHKAQQEMELANRELELEKEKYGIQQQQMRNEIAEQRHTLEAKASKLHAVVEQLELKRATLEEVMATLQQTQKGLETQVEALRARELLVLEGNQKAQATQQTMAQELQTMQREHENTLTEQRALSQQIEELSQKRDLLAIQEAELRTAKAKLNDEIASLDAYLETEREKRLQLAASEAQQKADGILQAAREQAMAYSLEKKSDLESEMSGERARLKQELEALRAREETALRDRQNNQSSELTAAAQAQQRELAEKRALTEKEIAERMVIERKNLELRREEEAREEQKNRRVRIVEISKSLEHAIGTRFHSVIAQSGEEGEKVRGLLDQIPALVERAFDPNAVAMDKLGVDALKVDLAGQKKAARFWLQTIGTASVVVLLTGALIVSRDRIGSYFAHLGTEPEAKMVAKARPQYSPPTDFQFKSGYTDNVLYTARYTEMKQDPALQKRWIVELNRFFLDQLKLDEKAIVKFAASESTLINELARLKGNINPSFEKEGVQRLRDAEASALPELASDVGGPDNLRREQEFERGFYARSIPPDDASRAPASK